MSTSFDEAWADSVIAQLRRRGTEIAPGLTDDGIAEIGAAFGVTVPAELSLFLRAGPPVSDRWADWRRGAQVIRDETMAWLDRTIAFDIEHGDYWHPLLGEKPPDMEDAIVRATSFLRSAPPLIPIYAHRYLTTAGEPRAVLSIWQAIDSIVYGNDLADYLAREFRLEQPDWATVGSPAVPVWERLLDLHGAEGTDDL